MRETDVLRHPLYTGLAAKARSTHSRTKQEGFQKKTLFVKTPETNG